MIQANCFEWLISLRPTADDEVPEGQRGTVDLVKEEVGFEDVCGGECVGSENIGDRRRRIRVEVGSDEMGMKGFERVL